jgi:1,4-alpha-glucan branching enzyme
MGSSMTSVDKDGTVEFWFYRRDVREVRVVGDFAGWRGGTFEMADDGNGWWRLTTTLDASEYRFRYVADGQWYTDYASNGIEMVDLGVNSVLVVPERQAHPPRTESARMVA